MVKIILWKYRKSKKWYENLVGKAIVFFTGESYTHAAVCVYGMLYQSTVMKFKNGAMKSWGCPKNETVLGFKEPLNDKQTAALLIYLNKEIKEHAPYNFLKLFILMIVYPTRWFWNWIGWVPFQAEFFGNVCSVYVDTAFRKAGVDLLPDANEEFTVPGDFVHSNLLRRE